MDYRFDVRHSICNFVEARPVCIDDAVGAEVCVARVLMRPNNAKFEELADAVQQTTSSYSPVVHTL